jgi:hypothetical protein
MKPRLTFVGIIMLTALVATLSTPIVLLAVAIAPETAVQLNTTNILVLIGIHVVVTSYFTIGRLVGFEVDDVDKNADTVSRSK